MLSGGLERFQWHEWFRVAWKYFDLIAFVIQGLEKKLPKFYKSAKMRMKETVTFIAPFRLLKQFTISADRRFIAISLKQP